VVAGHVVPVGPVLDMSYTAPPMTLQAAANDAKDKADQMQLVSTTIPLVALISGAVLLLSVIGVAVVGRRRQVTIEPTVRTPMRELTPVG
jgi:hypothetical protein